MKEENRQIRKMKRRLDESLSMFALKKALRGRYDYEIDYSEIEITSEGELAPQRGIPKHGIDRI